MRGGERVNWKVMVVGLLFVGTSNALAQTGNNASKDCENPGIAAAQRFVRSLQRNIRVIEKMMLRYESKAKKATTYHSGHSGKDSNAPGSGKATKTLGELHQDAIDWLQIALEVHQGGLDGAQEKLAEIGCPMKGTGGGHTGGGRGGHTDKTTPAANANGDAKPVP